MKLKKYLLIGCTVIALASLTACNKSSENTAGNTGTVSTETENTESESTAASSTVYGKVTAVDDNTVTLALGDMGQGGKGEAPSGEKPTGEAPSGEAPSGEAPSGEKPSGEKPSDMGGGFTENGETQTLTIDDESKIQIQDGTSTSQGSLSDIAVDSILSIEYAEDQSVSAIIVQSVQ